MRYRRESVGIAGERITPDLVAVVVTSGTCLVLGVLGIITVIVF